MCSSLAKKYLLKNLRFMTATANPQYSIFSMGSGYCADIGREYYLRAALIRPLVTRKQYYGIQLN